MSALEHQTVRSLAAANRPQMVLSIFLFGFASVSS